MTSVKGKNPRTGGADEGPPILFETMVEASQHGRGGRADLGAATRHVESIPARTGPDFMTHEHAEWELEASPRGQGR
jgi:hypothetical protein